MATEERPTTQGDKDPAQEKRFKDVVIELGPFRNDINTYLFEAEKKNGVEKAFLGENLIRVKMRAKALNNSVKILNTLEFSAETLYRTINLFDNYLSRHPEDKSSFDLISAGCMSLAAKFEEKQKKTKASLFAGGNILTPKAVTHMETKLLGMVQVLERPVVTDFIQGFGEYLPPKVFTLAQYISEHAAASYATCHLKPSVIAAVSLWMAAKLDEHEFANRLYDVMRVPKQVVHDLVPTFASGILRMKRKREFLQIRRKYEKEEFILAKKETDMLQNLEDIRYVAQQE